MVDALLFKQGMRRLAASVCMITTCSEDGERFGLTATAVCSLSADPPMLISCLNRSSHTFPVVANSGRFCVNVVQLEDVGVAHRFSSDRSAAEKFESGRWTTGASGAPILTSAIASFDCQLEQLIEVGTHGVCIGKVVEVRLGRDDARPLLYTGRGYGQFTVADDDLETCSLVG